MDVYDRFYFFYRSSKNKRGTVEVGYFERWKHSISVKETSEYSVGLLAASFGGFLAMEKEVISYHLLTPGLSLLPPQLCVTPSIYQCLKKEEKTETAKKPSPVLG